MIQKSNIMDVLAPFFQEPTKTQYLMGISRKIKLAHTSVKKALFRLVREGIVIETVEKRGKRRFPVYKADINSDRFRELKRQDNLQKLTDSGLLDYLEQKLSPKSMVLFGSYQRGEDLEDSDIDLFLECEEEEMGLERYEKMLGRKIQLHFKEDFTKYPSELKNNIINGTIMRGYLVAYK